MNGIFYIRIRYRIMLKEILALHIKQKKKAKGKYENSFNHAYNIIPWDTAFAPQI